MKIGKIPETVLKRSVLKLIKHRRNEVLTRPGIGVDCAQIGLAEDEILVMSSDPITGTVNDIGTLAVHITANDIAASGAEPIGIMVTALLPQNISEMDIKQYMREIEEACASLNMEVIGGHTEVTAAVNQIIISVTGIGKMKKNRADSWGDIKPGYDVVITKWAGLEGTSIIAKEKEEQLKTRYTGEFIEQAKGMLENISVVEDARIASDNGAVLMHDVTEGGVFGALWEIACAGRCGIEVELSKIPIRQETVEICEFFDLNPYMLISSGSLAVVVMNGYDLVDSLAKKGISAAVVGKITDNNDKIIVNSDGERRYLAPPQVDELYKALADYNTCERMEDKYER